MTQTKRPVRPTGSAQQAPRRRPAAPVRYWRAGRMPYDFWPLVAFGAVIIALACVLQLVWPNGFPLMTQQEEQTTVVEIHASGAIRINELMSANASVLVDEGGLTSDWIEIANVGNSAVNLEGYSLAKSEKSNKSFVFPDCTLQPGECVIVFANSALRNEVGGEFHAPFKLSSLGGTLMLFNSANTAIDSVNFPAMTDNTAYIRVDRNTWSAGTMSTPGMLNTEENYRARIAGNADAGIEIVELMAENSQYLPDENGMCQDYFVLHNTTGAPIDLSGWFVSDTADRAVRWRIPDGTVLEAGGNLAIHASGLDRSEDPQHLHTSFGLNAEGESVVVADATGRIVDRVDFGLLKMDQAYVKQSDGSWMVSSNPPVGSAQ